METNKIKEPAQCGGCTSSKNNNLHNNDTSKSCICQEADYKSKYVKCVDSLCDIGLALEKMQTMLADIINDFDFTEDPLKSGVYQGARCMHTTKSTPEELNGLRWILGYKALMTHVFIINDYAAEIKKTLDESREVG